MIDLATTGIRRSAKFDLKPRQKYGLLGKLSLAVIGLCEVANIPQVFLNRPN